MKKITIKKVELMAINQVLKDFKNDTNPKGLSPLNGNEQGVQNLLSGYTHNDEDLTAVYCWAYNRTLYVLKK